MNPLVEPGPALDPARISRYSRQLALPGFGEAAQRRLGAARVLVIGAGGLGSAVAPLLAAAGVGTVGVIDDDGVELSNLHRQLSHGVADIGRAKVDSLRDTIRAIDPDIAVDVHRVRATSASLPGILSSYDLLIDGSDNFATRYLASDAAELAGVPLVWGSILRFQGQVGVSWPGHGPGYRDLFARRRPTTKCSPARSAECCRVCAPRSVRSWRRRRSSSSPGSASPSSDGCCSTTPSPRVRARSRTPSTRRAPR
ncbi:MAG: HesA/MoeB/ThiF family protein [Microbacterium sp.]